MTGEVVIMSVLEKLLHRTKAVAPSTAAREEHMADAPAPAAQNDALVSESKWTGTAVSGPPDWAPECGTPAFSKGGHAHH